MAQLLVVDDEAPICWGLKKLGESLGHRVLTAASAEQALERTAACAPDAVFLDVRLPGMDGLTAVAPLRAAIGPVPIVVMTAYGDLETAARALRAEAFELLVKPFDLSQAQRVLERALAAPRASGSATGPAAMVHGAAELVGMSPAMREVFRQLAYAAASQGCVLIEGETGTGKELAARAVHAHSPRHAGPFVAVNLAAVSPSLAESELFGHVAGAFTGAAVARTGLVERASGGTLFLDEVAEIPLEMQVKLLRVLDQGEFWPVGAAAARRADLRVVSATHRDLGELVRAGKFREDLFHRLCTFRLRLPALVERGDDLWLLAEHFAAHEAARHGWAPPALADAFRQELRARRWPGNVRELKHALEHAVTMSRGGPLAPEHLPAARVAPLGAEPADTALRRAVSAWAAIELNGETAPEDLWSRVQELIEAPLLAEVLRRTGGNVSAAARILGRHRVTVRRRVDEQGGRTPAEPVE